MSEKVGTQKVILIPHSQGNFYANDLYGILAGKQGGVPTQSLGIYGVATPAKYVAGGGKWITSDTDKIIVENVRDFLRQDILPPNEHFTLESVDGDGHSFSEVYLKYAPRRIADEISESLDKLSTNETQDYGQKI